MEKVQELIEKKLKWLNLNDYMLDGEVCGKDWSHTMTITQTTRHKPNGEFSYRLFDIVNVERPLKPLEDRKELLEDIVRDINNPLVTMTTVSRVSSYREFKELFDYHLASGCDGSMIKDAKSPYVYKRSDHWWKIKPFHELDCKIVGFNRGEGKYSNTLGSIQVVIPINRHEWSTIPTNVSGMTDDERDEIWKNRKRLVGTIVEVKYRTVSKKKSRMIEPRFVRLRPDKDA